MPFDPGASFGKSLFFGDILEDQRFPYPEMPRDQAELVAPICATIDRYMAGIERRKLDRDGEFPAELLQSLKEMGLFGLIVPEEHGGLGLSNSGYARVMQQVASWDASIAVTLGAHSSIGFKGLLLFGNDAQKRRYLPKLASGENIAAFCLTEPGSGSDAFSIKTSARREGDVFVLNGQKLWITNGGIADFFTVFAKTTPDTPGQKGKITAFIVTRDLGGVTHGPHEDKMGIRASNTTAVFFDNVRIPIANVLGEEGKGFKVAMSILNHGRTGLGSGAVGGQKRLLQAAIAHATERKQPYEQAVRDARINRIFEGTNEILRLYNGITGMQKPGEYLKGLGKELANSLTDPIKGFGLLREYAVRKAKQTVPYGRTQITKAHESMREQVAYVEDAVQGLAALCDTVLRKHGREVVEMQFATSRIADVAIDLLALCVTIARTTRLIEVRGVAGCTNELNMTFAFYSDARHRIRANLRAGTGRNNDEEIKSVANHVIASGRYENDVLR